MKKIYTSLFLFSGFLLISLLGGCTSDGGWGGSSGCAPLSISSVRTSGVNTRSTTALNAGTLGIFRLKDTSSGIDTLLNVPYTGSAGGWTATGREVLMSATTQVCAYYPYNSSNLDYTQLPLTSWMGLPANTSSHELLYSSPTTAGSVSNGKSVTSLTLNRAYALLRFTLSGSSSSTGAGIVNSFSVYNRNLPQSSTINIASGITAAGTPAVDNRLYAESLGSPKLSDSPVIELLLPSCTLYDAGNTTLDVTITVDDVQRLVKLDLAANKINGALAAGTVYPINIQLGIVPQPESNCYIVSPGSTIYIPVSRASAGNSSFLSTDAFTAGLLWSDVNATHVTASAVGRYVKVTVPAGSTAEGNAVVYAMKGTDIIWSWHIWVTAYSPSVTVKPGVPTASGGTVPLLGGLYWMDRNLGATTSAGKSQTSLGLYYQWGRKDPFPAASGVSVNTAQTIFLPSAITTYPSGSVAITGDNVNVCSIGTGALVTVGNQASYAIKFPLLFLTSWAGSAATAAAGTDVPGGAYSWNAQTTNAKTIYDPCPVGWRVPYNNSSPAAWSGSPWKTLGTSGSAYISGTSSWNGSLFGMSVTSPATFYPASGSRNYRDGTLHLVGSYGSYWSGSFSGTNGSGVSFSSSNVYAFGYGSRASGFSVRCVQE